MRALFSGLVLLILFACAEEKPKNIEVNSRSYSAPAFNKDSAFAYVEKQVSFGPRVPGTEAQQQCADWLRDKLTSFGLETTQEEFTAKRFDGVDINGINIFGRLNPKAKKRIFISAHWDSRFMADFDTERKDEAIAGADDGASGVGVCMEVARILAQEENFNIGLDVVFFDAEDQGQDGGDNPDSWGIGAQKWSNKHKSSYRPEYGILLDMVGAKDARFFRERFSMQSAPQVVFKIWKVAGQMGYDHVFINQDGRGVVDDHYFINRNAGWPVADIIHTKSGGETGFGSHWHTHNDDMEVIDPNMLSIVGKVVTQVLVSEDLNKI